MLNIAFRADSSHSIGTGHIMRCLTLAHAILKQCSANIYFFSRKTEGNINNLIINSGFKLVEMKPPIIIKNGSLTHSNWLGETPEKDAQEFLLLQKMLAIDCLDYLIIDHYAIDQVWQEVVEKQISKIMVIDDLGDRIHKCNYLLDQTLNCQKSKYNNKIPNDCQLLLGSNFTLLRDEFRILDDIRKARKQANIHNLLVMFGGTDPNNLTLKTLKILKDNKDITEVNIILGATAAHLQSIISFTSNKSNLKLHIAPTSIAELMLSADLAIGSAGTSSWERCATGLPSIIIIDGENQREIASQLRRLNIISYFEEHQITSHLQLHLSTWIGNKAQYNNAIEQCLTICDGYGSQRVTDKLING